MKMKLNITYERLVLTIIAGLLYLNLSELKDRAPVTDTTRLPVKMASSRDEEKNYAVVPINADGSIDVRIVGSTEVIDVDIEKISTDEKLDVHLKSAETYSLNYAGPIEVKIK
jgi:hypothetical protein